MEKAKPKNPIAEIAKKKKEEYEALSKDIDRLLEYIKPIVGEDNSVVNKLASRIHTKLMMLPLTDLIQTTMQSSFGVFMAGKQFKQHEEEFNKIFADNEDNKEFRDFVKGKKVDY